MWKNFDKGKCLKWDWTKKSNNIAVFGWLGLPIVGWQGRKGPSSWKAFVAPSASLWQKPSSIRWWRGPTSWGWRGSPTLGRVSSRFFVQAGHKTTHASSGNIGFPNGSSFRYGNFFTSKKYPTLRKACLLSIVGLREARLFFPWAYFKVKFPYLKPTAHSEIGVLYESTK